MYSRNRALFQISAVLSLPAMSRPLFQHKTVSSKKNENVYTLQNVTLPKKFHTSLHVDKVFGTLNPFKALDTWYDLEKLKREWDPDFSLSDFKFGAKQALCMVVHHIQQHSWNELRGLVIRSLLERLQQDQETIKKIEKMGKLVPKNVIGVNVSRCSIQEIVDRKYCDIDVTFKVRSGGGKRIAFQYILRFHREYTKGRLPDWTITKILIEDKY